MTPCDSDYTARLRSLMQAKRISSYRDLARRAQVSDRQIARLRRGQADQMRLESLVRLSDALGCSLHQLAADFSALHLAVDQGVYQGQEEVTPAPAPTPSDSTADSTADSTDSVADPTSADAASLRHEYERLQAQLQQQKEQVTQELQQSALHTLESWMMSWPTVMAKLPQQPDLPASRLVPLVRPVERLLELWQVEAIATVGETVAYDPTQHQLMDGTATPGQSVRVRYVGYRHHGKLLHRAKVSPVENSG